MIPKSQSKFLMYIDRHEDTLISTVFFSIILRLVFVHVPRFVYPRSVVRSYCLPLRFPSPTPTASSPAILASRPAIFRTNSSRAVLNRALRALRSSCRIRAALLFASRSSASMSGVTWTGRAVVGVVGAVASGAVERGAG